MKKIYTLLIILISGMLISCGKSTPEVEVTTILPTQPPVELVVVTPTPLPSASPTPTLIPSSMNLSETQCWDLLQDALLQQKQSWNLTHTADVKVDVLMDISTPDTTMFTKTRGTIQIGETSGAVQLNNESSVFGETISSNTNYYGEIDEENQTYTEYQKEDGRWVSNIYRLNEEDTIHALVPIEEDILSFDILEHFLNPDALTISFKNDSTLRIEIPAENVENYLKSTFEDFTSLIISQPEEQELLPLSLNKEKTELWTEFVLDCEQIENIRIRQITTNVQIPFTFQTEAFWITAKTSYIFNTVGGLVYVEKPTGIESAIITDQRNYSLGYEFSDTFEDIVYHNAATPIYRNKEIKKTLSDDPLNLEFFLQGETHAIRQSLRYFIPEGYSIIKIQDNERDYNLKFNEKLPQMLTPYSVYLQGENLPAIVVQIQSTKKDMTLQNSEVIGVAYAGEDFILPKGITHQSSYRDVFLALDRPSETRKENGAFYAYWYYGDYTLLLKFVDDKLISFSISKNE